MAQKILVVDVGGTHLKILASGQHTPRKVISGRKMTARLMCNWVRKAASDWLYDVAVIGYPGPVVHGNLRQATPEASNAAQSRQMPMPEAPVQQVVPQRNAKHH